MASGPADLWTDHADARRALFLVDRSNLGKQAKAEFDGFIPPGSNRSFTSEFNVQHLTSKKLDDVARVTIATIQRLYSILEGEPELDPEADYVVEKRDRETRERRPLPEDIVEIVREEFGRGNDFCRKITYKITGKKPDELIRDFRNDYMPRIAVTVDMVATGTDIKPLEVVLFMRDVKSRVLFEQMKGRGVRVIGADELRAVTSDAESKSRFVIVDAVGVTEREEFNDSPPLNRNPVVSMKKLLDAIAQGVTHPEAVSTLAGRLARLDLQLDDDERETVRRVAGGRSLQQITGALVRALDPDVQADAARERFGLGEDEEPGEERVAPVREELIGEAAKPIASNPELRKLLLELKTSKGSRRSTSSARTRCSRPAGTWTRRRGLFTPPSPHSAAPLHVDQIRGRLTENFVRPL